jgi:hypothetical protein
MIRLALFAVLVSSAAACGTTVDAAPAAKAKPTSHDVCVSVFQKQRSCTDQYIPALVDLRAKLDRPAGIAAKVKADRAGVIAPAKAEWANDSKDAAIDQTCTKISADPDMVSAAQSCLAKTECGAFVSCIMPVTVKHLSK